MPFGSMISEDIMEYLRQYPLSLLVLTDCFFYYSYYNPFWTPEMRLTHSMLTAELNAFTNSLP